MSAEDASQWHKLSRSGIFFLRVGGVDVGEFGATAADVDGGEVADCLRHGLSDEAIDQAYKFLWTDQFGVVKRGEGSNNTLNGDGKVGVVLLGDVGGDDVNIWGNW